MVGQAPYTPITNQIITPTIEMVRQAKYTPYYLPN